MFYLCTSACRVMIIILIMIVLCTVKCIIVCFICVHLHVGGGGVIIILILIVQYISKSYVGVGVCTGVSLIITRLHAISANSLV